MLDPKTLDNQRAFIENNLWVQTKDNQLVPFKLNAMQSAIYPELGLRDILLKSRQFGYSTMTLGRYFTDAITIPNTTVAIISHADFFTQQLLKKVKVFYDNLPEPKPAIHQNSTHLMSFPKLGSTIYIGTAGASSAWGSGDTIHRLHISELAKWKKSEKEINEFMASCMEAVPQGGEVTIECTPCGDTGYFYDMVQDCLQGGSSWKLHVSYWWENPEYSLPPGHPLAIPGTENNFNLTEEEASLMFKHNLTIDQMRWRRWKAVERGELFLQEYIESVDTCFLGGEGMVFNYDAVMELAKEIRDPIAQEDNLKIWKFPRPGAMYIIGVDPATAEYTHDRTACNVIDIQTCEKVACIYGHYDQISFADELYKVGIKYNEAFMVVENNKGFAIVSALMAKDYPNLYYQEGIGGRDSSTPGYNMHQKRRPGVISKIKTYVNSRYYKTYDEDEIREMRNFIKIDGKEEARQGSFDDQIMASGIALSCMDDVSYSQPSFSGGGGWKW